MRIGLLHPGAMGETVGLTLLASGHDVFWCSAERSAASKNRAQHFQEQTSLNALCETVEAIVSVCPPASALGMARDVQQAGFDGVYIDANAIAPSTAEEVAGIFGSKYVDGGIIGPPAHRQGSTRLYLSGTQAESAQKWFSEGNLEASVINDGVSSASALKMAYAAYSKGSSALLLAVNTLAQHNGVLGNLHQEWQLSQPGLVERSENTALGVAGKAWRFVGAMEEIASTFEQAGLPGAFHLGAADFYRSLEKFKDQKVSLEEVLAATNAEVK